MKMGVLPAITSRRFGVITFGRVARQKRMLEPTEIVLPYEYPKLTILMKSLPPERKTVTWIVPSIRKEKRSFSRRIKGFTKCGSQIGGIDRRKKEKLET